MFYIAPSELRRRFTAGDVLDVSAYFKLKRQYENKAPPPLDADGNEIVGVDALVDRVMQTPESFGFVAPTPELIAASIAAHKRETEAARRG